MTTNNSWNSQDPAQVSKGGTGAATLTGVLTGNGTSAVTANTVTQHGVIIGGASNAVSSTAVGTATHVLTSNGAGMDPTFQAPAAGGDVSGPGSSTDNALARWDGTGGDTLQDSTVIVTDAGEMTNASQPAFLVTADSQTNVTGNATTYTVLYANEITDQGADFASSTFTAPITGNYQLTSNISVNNLGASSVTNMRNFIVTSNRDYRQLLGTIDSIDGNNTGLNGIMADLDAADTVTTTIYVNGLGADTAGVASGSFTYFSGFLAC